MENVKKVVQFVLSLFDAVKTPLSTEGKFSFRDLFSFGPVLNAFPPLSSFKQALVELENADDAKRAEINTFIKEKFSLDNKEVEVKIEAGLSLLLKLSGCVPEVKQLFAKLPTVLPKGSTQVGTVNVQAEQVNVVPQ